MRLSGNITPAGFDAVHRFALLEGSDALNNTMAALFRAVKSSFAKRPLLSNCLTYGALYAAAEFSQQTLIRKVLVSVVQDKRQ